MKSGDNIYSRFAFYKFSAGENTLSLADIMKPVSVSRISISRNCVMGFGGFSKNNDCTSNPTYPKVSQAGICWCVNWLDL